MIKCLPHLFSPYSLLTLSSLTPSIIPSLIPVPSPHHSLTTLTNPIYFYLSIFLYIFYSSHLLLLFLLSFTFFLLFLFIPSFPFIIIPHSIISLIFFDLTTLISTLPLRSVLYPFPLLPLSPFHHSFCLHYHKISSLTNSLNNSSLIAIINTHSLINITLHSSLNSLQPVTQPFPPDPLSSTTTTTT